MSHGIKFGFKSIVFGRIGRRYRIRGHSSAASASNGPGHPAVSRLLPIFIVVILPLISVPIAAVSPGNIDGALEADYGKIGSTAVVVGPEDVSGSFSGSLPPQAPQAPQAGPLPIPGNASITGGYNPPPTMDIDDLVLTADPTVQREFAFTNKLTGAYTGNTKKSNTRHWHGLMIRHCKFLENFYFKLGDPSGNLALSSDNFMKAEVYPYKILRRYNIGGVYHPNEEIFMPDYLDGLGIRYSSEYSGSGALFTQYDMHDIYSGAGTYSYGFDSPANSFWVYNDAVGEYIVLRSNTSLSFTSSEVWISKTYDLDKERGESGTATVYQPGYITFTIPDGGEIYFSYAVAADLSEAEDIALQILTNYTELMAEKKTRLQNLIDTTRFVTGDGDINRAIAWAKISLDGLIMQQYVGGTPAGIGIWAGLHWFPESWARDLFISFPAATLCTGQFQTAAEIINMMSSLQNDDENDITFGRVPNRILPGDPSPAYSSADGTPWFLRELYEYFQYTGNVSFLNDHWDVIKNAVDGVISKRTDDDGLIVHGPGLTGHLVETWMDGAVNIGGELVANSPRDNRAIEIQALWYTAIKSAVELAEYSGNIQGIDEWRNFTENLKRIFPEKYYDPGLGYCIDHINPDDTPDTRIRPNQLFAISVPWDDLLNYSQEENVLDTVRRYLIFDHGVATLNREDVHNWGDEDVGYRGYDYGGLSDSECFKDPQGHWVGNSWSYHNGMVWPWLAGPAVQAFAKHNRLDVAYNLTSFHTDLLLNRGCLGSICEILPGDENRPTGTMDQAWSLAEYIRPFYQTYLGIRPLALEKRIFFTPAVPDELGNISARIRIGDGAVDVNYAKTAFYNDSGRRYDAYMFAFAPNDLEGYTLVVNLRLFDRYPGMTDNLTFDAYINGHECNVSASTEPYGKLIRLETVFNGSDRAEIIVFITNKSEAGPSSMDYEGSENGTIGAEAVYIGLNIILYSALIYAVLTGIIKRRTPAWAVGPAEFKGYLRKKGFDEKSIDEIAEKLKIRNDEDVALLARILAERRISLIYYLSFAGFGRKERRISSALHRLFGKRAYDAGGDIAPKEMPKDPEEMQPEEMQPGEMQPGEMQPKGG